MYVSVDVDKIIKKAREYALIYKHEFVTPDHMWLALCDHLEFKSAVRSCGGDSNELKNELQQYLEDNLEVMEEVEIEDSYYLQRVYGAVVERIKASGKNVVEIDHLVSVLLQVPESYAVYTLSMLNIDGSKLLYELCHNGTAQSSDTTDEDEDDEDRPSFLIDLNAQIAQEDIKLIGREEEIFRTLQIMGRKTKNNPLHIGEAGVGKTAIAYELVRRINDGSIDDAQVYGLDIAGMLAGTQYRGDFENRFKAAFDYVKKQENPIVYIDEMHTIVGAGAIGGGSMDASNLLKPYLSDGKIKFIGASTFEEYKKYLEKDKGLIRRFQTIEIKEPTAEEALDIVKGIKHQYEQYHEVTYTDEAIEKAVILSSKYMNDRYLPDKAIDLIDEAGSTIRLNNPDKQGLVVDEHMMEKLVARICRIPEQTVVKDEKTKLKNLESNLKRSIFGQQQAIEAVSRCIKLSRSGLGNPNKPVANMLFVGPTGVGKTEIARCLATTLGIKLIRFDMSEYIEKHAASKLIGAPPGYVGYEEGGLLTDEIRKTPHCVLLLDEIEKAHVDIFSMLLQVMDYATLTDNQGRKVDFRNVIIIMTSNAGASSVGKKLVGFGERELSAVAIDEAVKKTFTPEFRNRLDATITFNGVDESMALKIAKKEIEQLKDSLAQKNITITMSPRVISYLAKKGTTVEYGAREIARTIEHEVKTLLVEEVLFGKLANGGSCKIVMNKGHLKLEITT
ncbi:MAG: ATP-dependent Clp protease ATP-binding subunit ClpA [Epulopiscium sp. Nele67-Bin001]|nr:MAG: ATP-dependent Clp protease ATP-binding subunit ClpA [Epulopiscium sp. Nele67-Bin001]